MPDFDPLDDAFLTFNVCETIDTLAVVFNIKARRVFFDPTVIIIVEKGINCDVILSKEKTLINPLNGSFT